MALIPNQVTTIITAGLMHDGIRSLSISKNVITIGSKALYGNALTEIVIPSTVQTIGTQALFKNSLSNKNLTKIINKTGKAFNWKEITAGEVEATFVTGTIPHPYGDIVVTDK